MNNDQNETDSKLSHHYGDDPHSYAPWEKAFDKIATPFEEFIHHESTGGLLLMACALLALIVANSPVADSYFHFFHTSFSVGFGSWSLDMSLHHWINDGLMALFFFLVGLEIKREVLVGELADPRQAVLPILAAIGGMIIPALIFFMINGDGPGAKGWGIPMATDIAFAVGVLVLLGKRVPRTVLTFLVALAIVDDLGAVVVIALFYTEALAWNMIAAAGGLIVLLMVLNLIGVRRPLPYLLVGLVLWLATLSSGLHATLAGVITALMIPARTKVEPKRFSQHIKGLLERFNRTLISEQESGHGAKKGSEQLTMLSEEQRSIVQTLENGVLTVETPLQRMEHAMHLPVAWLIVPLFALANAGIPISADSAGRLLTDPVLLGVTFGLVVGKLVGVAGVTWVAIKMGLGRLPEGATINHIIGVGFIAGIGFTMSIFIAELGFPGNDELLLMAKTGVLIASLVAGIAGALWFLWMTPKPKG